MVGLIFLFGAALLFGAAARLAKQARARGLAPRVAVVLLVAFWLAGEAIGYLVGWRFQLGMISYAMALTGGILGGFAAFGIVRTIKGESSAQATPAPPTAAAAPAVQGGLDRTVMMNGPPPGLHHQPF